MLFTMFSLTIQLQSLITASSGQIPSEQAVKEDARLVQLYKEKGTQCLVLGNFTRCEPYTVEALMAYMYTEYFAHTDTHVGPWSFMAMVIRIAMRMGYHRDGSHIAHLTPFQAEMRRRVWLVVSQMDIMTSSQIGLPRMIKETRMDSREPSNYRDEDLWEDMTELPPPRPYTTVTRVLTGVLKHRLLLVGAQITDVTSSTYPSTYGEVMQLE